MGRTIKAESSVKSPRLYIAATDSLIITREEQAPWYHTRIHFKKKKRLGRLTPSSTAGLQAIAVCRERTGGVRVSWDQFKELTRLKDEKQQRLKKSCGRM